MIKYREAVSTDLPFIISTWLKGARNAERHTFMSNKEYFTYYRHCIIQTMAEAFVIIAYDDAEPDVIVGYAVYQVPNTKQLVLHYVYVRKMLWGMKIAKNLIAHIEPDYATKEIVSTTLLVFHNLLAQKYKNFTYNPYVIKAVA